MPAKVKVRILAGRNLPVMDKSSDASDAFVEVKLGNTTYKTEVYRRSLNPFWNSEWFRFEVSDQELQDEPLQIRIMDYDTYSANDAIGKVYINLNPLLINPGRSMSGWLPIYDTLHGIRGEINCMVKVNLFADNNRYRHSSCGVRFFFSDIPNGYKCDAILGFVDELLVNDDPEYQWIDKIRTPRASNEARQTLFTKLSGEVQRKLGLKAEVFGGNAVIGYQQSFDLEGSSGIVGRGIGTAVVLSKIGSPYEGIISPVQMNDRSAPHPYFVDGYQHNNRQDRSNRSYYIPKNNHPDRHLIHSISADYFYEVPSTGAPQTKRLSTNLDIPLNQQLSKQLTRSGTTNSDTLSEGEDVSEYEDCEETLSQQSDASDNNDINDNDDDDDDYDEFNNDHEQSGSSHKLKSSLSSLSSSERRRKKKLFRLAPNLLGRSILVDSKELRNKISPQSLSVFAIADTLNARSGTKSNSILKKIRQSNEIISQTVSNVTKPITSSSSKLTKLLSLRRQTAPNQQHPPSNSLNDSVDQSGQQLQRQHQNNGASSIIGLEAPATEASAKLLTPKLAAVEQSAFSEAPSGSSTSCSSGSIILKRRRDKSQSASLEDALSIIEEKLDDDEHNQTLHRDHNQDAASSNLAAPRVRRLSGPASSTKYRPMLRTKEIDLNDDENMADLCVEAPANVDETEIDETPSSMADDAKQAVSESLLSSSSPSTSVLTDETVKARDFSSPLTPQSSRPRPLSYQLSSPLEQHPTINRSDTDSTLATDRTTKSSASFSSDLQSAALLVPVQTDAQMRSSPDFRFKSKYSNSGPVSCSNSNQFAQSVRTVRAQQHLLQNMIRHQNQNLLHSSCNKAKNAFMYPNRVHQSEYPFVTLKKYPANMIQCTGGVVSVHSVKLLDHIINDEESETRDVWWTEIRKEIRSHAKALNCNTILGYSETSKVIGDVCVLSACGTAAILRSAEQLLLASSGDPSPLSTGPFGVGHNVNSRSPTNFGPTHTLKVPRLSASPPPSHSSMPPPALTQANNNNNNIEFKKSIQIDHNSSAIQSAAASGCDYNQQPTQANHKSSHCQQPSIRSKIDCSFCHTSLACVESVASLANCTICGLTKVPDVLLLTIEPPQNLNIVSSVSLVQARVCRAKRDAHGEANAKEIGEALPFLEYELHRQLFTKLKFKGMNCLFDLSVDISVGENMITGLATGTGCFVLGLPEPEPPQISAGKGIKTFKLDEIQQLISLSAMRNRQLLGLDQIRERLAKYQEETSSNGDSSNNINSLRPLAVDSFAREHLVVGGSNEILKNQSDRPSSATGLVDEASSSFSELPFTDDQQSANKIVPPGRFKSSTSSEYYLPLTSSSQRSQRKYQHGNHHNHHHHHRHHHHHHHHQQHHHQNHKGSADTTTENLLSLLTDDNNIVLEVDDNEDADIIAQLIDNDIPKGYFICNCESPPNINQTSILSINMFTQVMRVKLSGLEQFSQQFEWILQALFVKLRRSLPCCLTNINFVVDLPETNVVQISVTGCLLGLSSSPDALDMDIIGRDQTLTSQQQKQQPLEERLSSLNQAETSKLLRQLNANNQQQQFSNSITTSSSSSSLTSTPSTTTHAPSSSSSPSSGASSSSASSVSSKHSSSHKFQSAQVTIKKQPREPISSSNRGETIAKSITKQLSKTNIAALISGKKWSPSREGDNNNSGSIELAARNPTATEGGKMMLTDIEPAATRAAVVAAMKESQQQTSPLAIRATASSSSSSAATGQQEQTTAGASRTAMIRSMRAVFKKQQTYPGATSPQISGQDRLLPPSDKPPPPISAAAAAATTISTATTATTTTIGDGPPPQTSPGSSAARRATIILNKVKQPLKDLGSNFNTTAATTNTSSQSQSAGQTNGRPIDGQQTTAALSNLAAAAGQKSKLMSRSSSARVPKTTTTASSSRLPAHLVTSSSSHVIGGLNSIAASSSLTKQQQTSSSAIGTAAQMAMQTITATATRANSKKVSESSSMNSSIDITSLSYIPGAKEYHYLGNLSFSFVRETNSVRENGGLNGFIHCFLMEVYAIVRAHVSALGGNAFLSFRLQQSCIFYHSNKNQAQCLISVAGDAVQVAI